MSDKTMSVFDTKLIVWIVSLVFCAGGGWMKLGFLGERVTKVEHKQDVLNIDIRTIIKNQATMCQALDVECK